MHFQLITSHFLKFHCTNSWELPSFTTAIRIISRAVDDVLSCNVTDPTQGAVYFGFIIDLYASPYHMPEQMIVVFGSLGSYADMEAVREDLSLQERANRVRVYQQGVDAIFFYVMTPSDRDRRSGR